MRLVPILLLVLLAGTRVNAVEPNKNGIECPLVPNLALVFLQGGDLHPSLATPDFPSDALRDVPARMIKHNPQLDSDPGFVEAIARSSTHGRHGARGLSAALFARYLGEDDIGFYGLEATTEDDADWWEQHTRNTWAKNESLGRARVHRAGHVVLVVWNDGISPEIWAAVNTVVEERLKPLVGATHVLPDSSCAGASGLPATSAIPRVLP